jgi:GNAT superfamily N-acetyltransferase
MPPAVIVEPLAHHRELVPLVAEWFLPEWPSWYGPGGPGNLAHDADAFAASDSALPVGMVIFESHVPVGAGALKEHSVPSHAHLSPWAAAGYVLPSCRGRGLGAMLLQALVARAHALGFERVYCGTSTAERLLSRAGWQPLEVIDHAGKPLTIFQSAA